MLWLKKSWPLAHFDNKIPAKLRKKRRCEFFYDGILGYWSSEPAVHHPCHGYLPIAWDNPEADNTAESV